MAKAGRKSTAISSAVSELAGAFENLHKTQRRQWKQMDSQIDSHGRAMERRMHKTLTAMEELGKGLSRSDQGWRTLQANISRNSIAMQEEFAKMSDEMQAVSKQALLEQANQMELTLGSKLKMFAEFFTKLDKDSRKMIAPNGVLSMMFGMVDNRRMRKTLQGAHKVVTGIVKGLGEVLKKFGKTLKKMASDIWTWVLKTAKEVFDTIKDILFGNVFKEMQTKLNELRNMFMEFPGAEAALQNLRAIRDTMVEIKQQYGATVEQAREFTNIIYEQSNALYSVADNVRALHAAQRQGVRGADATSAYTADIARLALATGQTEDQAAEFLTMLDRQLGQDREQRNQTTAAFHYFTQQMAQRYDYGADVATIQQLYSSARPAMIRAGVAGGTETGFQQAAMVTAQLARATGADPQQLMDFLSRAGTTEGGSMMDLLGNPQQVLAKLRSGDISGFWQGIGARFETLTGDVNDPDARAMFMAELDKLGLGISVEQLLLLESGLDHLPDIGSAAASALTDVGDGAAHLDEAADNARTPLERLERRFEAIANNSKVAGVTFAEFLDVLDMSSTYFDELMGGFSMVEQGINMAFGPLGGLVNTITTPLMTLGAIGGVLGNFDLGRLGEGSMLGQLLGAGRDLKAEFWDGEGGLKQVLTSLWGDIKTFFQRGPDGERSMFGEMIHEGVAWVQENGPQIITDVTAVITELFWALGVAFDELEDSNIGNMLSDLLIRGLLAALPVIRGAVDTFITVAQTIFDVLRQVLTDPRLRPALTDFGTALIDGMMDILGTLSGPFAELASVLVSVMAPVMSELGQQLWFGIVTLMPDPIRDTLGMPSRERMESIRTGYTTFETAVSQYATGSGSMENIRGTITSLLLNDIGDVENTLSTRELSTVAHWGAQAGGVVGAERPGFIERGLNFITAGLAPGRTADAASEEIGMGAIQDWGVRYGDEERTTAGDEAAMVIRRAADFAATFAGLNYTDDTLALMGFSTYGHGDGEHGGYFLAPKRGGGFHLGTDLVPIPLDASGTIAPLTSPWGGQVVDKGVSISGLGNVIVLAIPDIDNASRYAVFGHLAEVPPIDLGADVAFGDVIGEIGSSGNAEGLTPHVHIAFGSSYLGEGTYAFDEYFDPLPSLMSAYDIEMPREKDPNWWGYTQASQGAEGIHPWRRLAEGGIVLSEMIARVGERGPEVIMPLEELHEKDEERTQKLIDAIREQTETLSLLLEAAADGDNIMGFIGGKG